MRGACDYEEYMAGIRTDFQGSGFVHWDRGWDLVGDHRPLKEIDKTRLSVSRKSKKVSVAKNKENI